jgi:formylglycine-generating enzyme required for sulfatase activity
MVYIPEGPFTLGEPSTDARAHAAFFRSDSAGEPAGLVRIDSEDAIAVGPDAGSLYYQHSNFAQYEGDQQGPVPDAFPKGFDAFYVMKYEITQGQYASFLNTLSDSQTAMRDNRGGRAPARSMSRATIRLDDETYIAGAPNRPANFISWDDGCAFADWAGLRPMTELEFTKACRGPEEPIEHQFPWGTASKDRLARVMGDDLDLVASGRADEGILSDDKREVLGASYYWVMDLAGSVWERCVTIGHPIGRAFSGTHGDGRINSQGYATNDDWPRGDSEIGGYGYRGGGHYEHGREYTPSSFNPHSPIAWRRFGSWGGAPRYIAYGFRCARTAP